MIRRWLVLGLAVVLVSSVAGAADCDCPVPKPIPCERLKELKAQRCPPEALEVKIVERRVEVPVPGPERVVTVEKRVEVPGPERVVVKEVPVAVEAPRTGHFLLGVGPVRFHSLDDEVQWGGAAVAGWQFASGWQIQAGPLWMPQDDFHGAATDGCRSIPYRIEAPNPWAVQALAVYAF